MNCTVRVAKTKALISCAVTEQLILCLCSCIYRQKSDFLLTLLKKCGVVHEFKVTSSLLYLLTLQRVPVFSPTLLLWWFF